MLSWTVMIPDNDPDTYRSDLDWENSTDSCKEMELAVGIGYPNRLESYGNEFRIYTEMRTPRGNDAGTDVKSDLQAPENNCPIGVNPNTTCMGLDPFAGDGSTNLLKTGSSKPFPGSWHWEYVTGVADWEEQKCASYGAIGDAYRRNNSSAGPLGACSTWEYPGPRNGRQQNYANGRIHWHQNTGAWAVHGAIGAQYDALQDANGPLRYPTSDELNCPTRPNCKFNRFETGNIYWSPATGAHGVHGAIFAEYARQGYETGRFGLPTTSEFAIGADRQVNFERGWIRWVAATGAIITS
ncbi:LGFP repeat-containing protein [Rhodococcus sp. NPDC058521]|uniref:LGFP repeat-containing protein n=1 Tax=Rhodococcus sp. NPDC058521 TaxID=3346536 RepID=UPI00364AC552